MVVVGRIIIAIIIIIIIIIQMMVGNFVGSIRVRRKSALVGLSLDRSNSDLIR